MTTTNQQQLNNLNDQISTTTNQSTNSRNKEKYVYHNSNSIYYSKEIRNKKGNDRLIYNIYGQYVDHKQNLLILEDFSLDCYFHVRINEEIESFFEKCYYPWFVFRLHRVEVTAAQTNYNKGPKTIYCNLNAKECINWIVVFSLLSNQNQLIKIHKSKNPTFEEHDKRMINEFRDRWTKKVTRTSICEFRNLKEKKDCFVAQIIEIKQISPHKIILKVWDGTTPEFDLRLPINMSHLNNDFDYKVHLLKDAELDQKTKGKQCYVYLVGERHVEQFQFKKPGNYVLFVNCQFYTYTKMQPPVFRIELNELGIDKAYVKIFDEDTQIGKILTNKLRSHLDNLVDLDNDITTDVQLHTSPQNSFDHLNIQNNQIHFINDFCDIKKFNINYEIFCKIVDIYPLQYTIYDLIILKCTNCLLEDSVQNLFNFDLNGLRKSAFLFRLSNKFDSKVNCPG